jgi:hypothetical protein
MAVTEGHSMLADLEGSMQPFLGGEENIVNPNRAENMVEAADLLEAAVGQVNNRRSPRKIHAGKSTHGISCETWR